MTEDVNMTEGLDEEYNTGGMDGLVERIVLERPRYIGIYAPGDFKIHTYRLVLPNPSSPKRGRGFQGAREDVAAETIHRAAVDELIKDLQALAETPIGPLAVRHIINPSTSKDEGVRLVWPGDSAMGEMEIADWPRRDKLIREGKTVCAMEGVFGWIPETVFLGSFEDAWGNIVVNDLTMTNNGVNTVMMSPYEYGPRTPISPISPIGALNPMGHMGGHMEMGFVTHHPTFWQPDAMCEDIGMQEHLGAEE